MSFLNKLKQQLDKAEATTKELIENMFVSEELHKQRLDICNSCEHLFKPTKNCKKCGCFVTAKTKLTHQKCPIDKW